MISGILAASLQEVIEGLGRGVLQPAKQESYITIHKHVRGSREEIEAFYSQIQALLRRCEALQEGRDKREYGLTLIFHPIAKTEEEQTTVQFII